MKLIIDRKKWGRGDSSGGELLNYEGKMCCLGFLGLKCGLTQKNILERDMPCSVLVPVKRNKTVWGKMINNQADDSKIAKALAGINDSMFTSDEIKEDRITRKFKKIGVEVKFKN